MTDYRGSHGRSAGALCGKPNGALQVFGLALILSLLSHPGLAQTSPPAPAAPPAMFAFAKASPISVFDSAALTGGHPQEFEFGKAYEATEGPAEYVKLKLGDDKFVYVRSAYVATMGSPRWLMSTPDYNRSESDRARIRFWENPVRLTDFLSSINVGGSQYDYEEYFDAAPTFQLKLPIVQMDAVERPGSDQPVKMASIMTPISRQMYEAFEKAKKSSERPLDLNFLVDVSGSTNGFLERVSAGIVKALNREEQFRKRIRSIVLTTFGATRESKSSFLGKVSLKDIENFVWHPSGVNQTTSGEREPLVDALVAMNGGLKADDAAIQMLIILSGADVELASTASGKPLAIGELKLSFRSQPTTIIAQITPEPGDDLRNAGGMLRDISLWPYIEYSDSLADDVVLQMIRAVEKQKTVSLDPRVFGPVLRAGNEKRMMTFLPRILTPAFSLPARQIYAAQSDWYTVRLWLPVNPLIWKETTQ